MFVFFLSFFVFLDPAAVHVSTTMGQIAAAAGAKHTNESPLTIEIEQFVKMTAFIATITGFIFFVLGMVFVDDNFLTQFVFLVGEMVLVVVVLVGAGDDGGGCGGGGGGGGSDGGKVV